MKKSVLLFLLATVCVISCKKDFNAEPKAQNRFAENNQKINFFEHKKLNTPYEPGVMLIQFSDGEINTRLIDKVHGKKLKTIHTNAMQKAGYKPIYKIQVDNVEEAVKEARRTSGVKYATPNFVNYTEDYPNDSAWVVNPDAMWGMRAIHADAAWASGNYGSNDVVIAVSDQGIFGCHEDLQGQVWKNPGEIPDNGIDDDGNGYIDDINGWNFFDNTNVIFMGNEYHGTHVAGTVGAIGNNTKGVIGGSPHVTLISLKFLHGTDGYGYNDAAIQSFDYVIDLKQRYHLNLPAITASWGGGGFDQFFLDVIARCKAANIICNFAAGNSYNSNDDPTTRLYPAGYTMHGADNEIAVGAADWSLNKASFSNYGKLSVTVFAPGTGILSAGAGTGGTSIYRFLSGTSMATPHVAAAIALYSAGHPNCPYSEIINAIKSTANPLPTITPYCQSGLLDVSTFTATTPQTTPARECFTFPQDNTPPTQPIINEVINLVGAIELKFTPSTDNTGVSEYLVLLREETASDWQRVYSWAGDNWNDIYVAGLPDGVKFVGVLYARDSWGNTSPTSAFSGTPLKDTTILAPPIDLRFYQSEITETSFSPNWTPGDPSQYIQAFNVYFRVVGAASWQMGSVPSGYYHTTITGLQPGTTYEWYVTAFRNITGPNESAPSVTVQTRTLGDSTNPPPPPTKPTINSFSANPATIDSGQVSTLSWTVTDATTISINGEIVTGNSKVVSPASTTTYTLTASNSAGDVTAQTIVTVNAAPPPPPPSDTTISISGVGKTIFITKSPAGTVEIQRSAKQGGSYSTIATTSATTYFIIMKPKKWYRVKFGTKVSNEIQL